MQTVRPATTGISGGHIKPFTKLLLGAVLAASTSFAYADTLGAGSLSFGPSGYGSGITYTATSMKFAGTQAIEGTSAGSLGIFTGVVSVVDSNIPSFAAIVANTEFFTTTATNGSGDVLTYYLDSLTGTDIAGILNVHGTGYFTDSAFTGETPATLDFSASGGGHGVTTTAYEGSASITPEPSSLLLFGTGLLGAAGIARRKFAAKFV